MADEKKRIIDYPETNTVGDDDFLLMSQYNETTEQYDSKKVKAVKVGGGGGAILGTSEPTAATGEDNQLYFLREEQLGWNYLKFINSTTKTGQDGATEYSDIRFKGTSGYYSFTGSSIQMPNYSTSSDGAIQNIIDGNSATFTRHYSGTALNPATVFIDLATPLNTNNYDTFELWTGRYDGMCPATFSLYGSVDGINWIQLLDVTGADTPANPESLSYSADIPESNFDSLINREYIKYNGVWLPANFNEKLLSLKERVVDIVNGKSLYQRTIKVLGFNTFSFADIGLGNDIDADSIRVITNFHRFYQTSTGEILTGQAYFYGDTNNWWRFYFELINKTFVTGGTWGYGWMELFVTIQYFKS